MLSLHFRCAVLSFLKSTENFEINYQPLVLKGLYAQAWVPHLCPLKFRLMGSLVVQAQGYTREQSASLQRERRLPNQSKVFLLFSVGYRQGVLHLGWKTKCYTQRIRIRWEELPSSSSSRTDSTDFLDSLSLSLSLSLSPTVPIIHRLQQLFQTTSYVRIELKLVSSWWLVDTCTSMCRGSLRTSIMSCISVPHVFFVLLGGFLRWEVSGRTAVVSLVVASRIWSK